MKLFFAYLRQRWKVLLGAVLFYALFAVSFALYGLPLAAVWYPAVLTAVLVQLTGTLTTITVQQTLYGKQKDGQTS